MGACGSKNTNGALDVVRAPAKPKFKVAIIGLDVPGGNDKDMKGRRFDSVPIANGIVKHGMQCDLIKYDPHEHDAFVAKAMDYDGVIVRFQPGLLDQPKIGLPVGAQRLFDNAMDTLSIKGKAVWSSPVVRHSMGAKDALVKIKDMACGLPDTFAYYDYKSFDAGFKKSCAFSPRVIKQNRGRDGEGVWLVWLESKRYCETFGEKSLTDRDRLKLMEMSDNHVEYHTVKEFVDFCVNGPSGKNILWSSSFPGKYLEGGKAAGGQIVDQRLLPRIVEGEVRLQMVRDTVYGIVHKKPSEGEMTAVSSHAAFTYYPPDEPQFADLKQQFTQEMGRIFDALGIAGEPLPLFWTADFIPVDNHSASYVVGEFNCSCVPLDMFRAAIGSDLKSVARHNMQAGYRLTDLMGAKVMEQLEEMKNSGGFTSIGMRAPKPLAPGKPGMLASKPGHRETDKFKARLQRTNSDLARESTPLPVR